jgi:hypothetical protein
MALNKKGVGCGMHQLEVICSTVGWLKEAGQDLEYRKNHNRYWTGKLYVKQVGWHIKSGYTTEISYPAAC